MERLWLPGDVTACHRHPRYTQIYALALQELPEL
ncbi:hypothetical protein ACP70R_044468 [Stipagrostis hirtigluma subsp. patula]